MTDIILSRQGAETPFIIGSPPIEQANMTNLTRFETQDGVGLVINESEETFATVRGYASIIDVVLQTLM